MVSQSGSILSEVILNWALTTITGESICRRGGWLSPIHALTVPFTMRRCPSVSTTLKSRVAYFECHRHGLTVRKMNPLEAVKLLQRSPGHPLVRQYNCTTSPPSIALRFVTSAEMVTEPSAGTNSRLDSWIAVAKRRVAQAIAERKKRITAEIAIGAVRHGIIPERRQLLDTLVEGHRWTAPLDDRRQRLELLQQRPALGCDWDSPSNRI